MKLHRNAKTTPTSRLELVRRTVDDGWRYQAVADGYGVSVRTVVLATSFIRVKQYPQGCRCHDRGDDGR